MFRPFHLQEPSTEGEEEDEEREGFAYDETPSCGMFSPPFPPEDMPPTATSPWFLDDSREEQPTSRHYPSGPTPGGFAPTQGAQDFDMPSGPSSPSSVAFSLPPPCPSAPHNALPFQQAYYYHQCQAPQSQATLEARYLQRLRQRRGEAQRGGGRRGVSVVVLPTSSCKPFSHAKHLQPPGKGRISWKKEGKGNRTSSFPPHRELWEPHGRREGAWWREEANVQSEACLGPSVDFMEGGQGAEDIDISEQGDWDMMEEEDEVEEDVEEEVEAEEGDEEDLESLMASEGGEVQAWQGALYEKEEAGGRSASYPSRPSSATTSVPPSSSLPAPTTVQTAPLPYPRRSVAPLPPSLPPPTPGFEGWHVGSRYHMLRLLGSGSYGDVGEAWDGAMGRKVAIKRIRNVFDNITDARRIYREVYILKQLR